MGVAPEPPGDLSRVARGVCIGPFVGKAKGLNLFVNWLFFREGRGIPFAGNLFQG